MSKKMKRLNKKQTAKLAADTAKAKILAKAAANTQKVNKPVKAVKPVTESKHQARVIKQAFAIGKKTVNVLMIDDIAIYDDKVTLTASEESQLDGKVSAFLGVDIMTEVCEF